MASKNAVPEARDALNRFKMEPANEVGVNLKQGYNGDMASNQAGSVGGQIIKKMCPERKMALIRAAGTKAEHIVEHTYRLGIEL